VKFSAYLSKLGTDFDENFWSCADRLEFGGDADHNPDPWFLNLDQNPDPDGFRSMMAGGQCMTSPDQ